jgi:hypothetical protein
VDLDLKTVSRARLLLAAGLAAIVALAGCSSSGKSSSRRTSKPTHAHVLLVGTLAGKAGRYTTIQAAVNAAHPGDWILVAPGDYHERADESGPQPYVSTGGFGGVLITKSNLHLRGMDRAKVIVDGTKAGASACSPKTSDQDFGTPSAGGTHTGRNGILVWKADGVSIDNLTVCNFLAGTAPSGNEIWWNGGDDSAKIGLTGYEGSYLTATSTAFANEDSAAKYGIFSSNAAGPAKWTTTYASNFNDSGMYVGACLQVCNITIDKAWMEFSALGYSGTNSGGAIVIRNSEFDHNQDGFDTNTQIAGDPPAPQNGACPGNAISPITHTHSCWVFIHNNVHDNNNPNVPKLGTASEGPTGTGMTIAGGRNDTVMDNTFSDNGAWGVLFVPFPDGGTPSLHQTCAGSGGHPLAGFGCILDPEGNALIGNTFSHNGYFGNPSNGDFGQIVINAHLPRNCYSNNTAPNGSTPPDLEETQPTCGPLSAVANTGGPLLTQVLCDTGIDACPAGANYPQATGVVMHPLPTTLGSMPNPCAGVPPNAWCPKGRPRAS